MDVIIEEGSSRAISRAYEKNRLLIIIGFLVPLVFFSGYLIGIISTGIHIAFSQLTEENKRRFFEIMLPLFIVLPMMILYLMGRLFGAKRLLVRKGVLSIVDRGIKIENMEVPFGRSRITIYDKASFLSKRFVVMEICFKYGKYLYRAGDMPDFRNMRLLTIGGLREVKNIKEGDKVCVIMALTNKQLQKLVSGLEMHKQYLPIEIKCKSKKLINIMNKFQVRKNGRIILKDFTMIGF